MRGCASGFSLVVCFRKHWRGRKRDGHGQPRIALNRDVPVDLFNKRPHQPVAQRSFPETRHPDSIISDRNFEPLRCAPACVRKEGASQTLAQGAGWAVAAPVSHFVNLWETETD